MSAATVARMHGSKPDLQSAVISNRGHAPFLDEIDSIEAIDGFLAGID